MVKARNPRKLSATVIIAAITAIAGVVVAFVQFVLPNLIRLTANGPGEIVYVARIVDGSSGRAVMGARVTLEIQGVPPDYSSADNGYVRFTVQSAEPQVNARVIVDHQGYEPYVKFVVFSKSSSPDELRINPKPSPQLNPPVSIPNRVPSQSKTSAQPRTSIPSPKDVKPVAARPAGSCPDGGTVRKFFRDNDEDGFGQSGNSTEACSPPAGYVKKSGDCYDDNANAKPGQDSFFGEERGDGSFDYDCDNNQVKQWSTEGHCGSYPACDQGKTEGWKGAVPECGNTATWLKDCDYKNLKWSCVEETDQRRQHCK